jgi:hypothetical protein
MIFRIVAHKYYKDSELCEGALLDLDRVLLKKYGNSTKEHYYGESSEVWLDCHDVGFFGFRLELEYESMKYSLQAKREKHNVAPEKINADSF